MSDKIRRLPGALRHGGFSKIAILPGEDPDEFEQLHCGLIEEWRPNGPTEDDAVLTMAAAIWRKARLQKFRRARLYEEQYDPTCPTYDRALALHQFCSVIRAYPADFELALNTLPTEQANQLRTKFSQKQFDSIAKWISAITKEIETVMLPRVELPPNLPPEALLLGSAEFLSDEEFNKELVAEERLNGIIDRAMKRLIQAKGIKELLYRAPAVEDARKSTSTVRKIAKGK